MGVGREKEREEGQREKGGEREGEIDLPLSPPKYLEI